MEKCLVKIAICKKSLPINPAKFPVEVVTSWNIFGVVISYYDRKDVHDLIDAEYFGGEVLLLYF